MNTHFFHDWFPIASQPMNKFIPGKTEIFNPYTLILMGCRRVGCIGLTTQQVDGHWTFEQIEERVLCF